MLNLNFLNCVDASILSNKIGRWLHRTEAATVFAWNFWCCKGCFAAGGVNSSMQLNLVTSCDLATPWNGSPVLDSL